MKLIENISGQSSKNPNKSASKPKVKSEIAKSKFIPIQQHEENVKHPMSQFHKGIEGSSPASRTTSLAPKLRESSCIRWMP
jgi:hypothetical protein